MHLCPATMLQTWIKKKKKKDNDIQRKKSERRVGNVSVRCGLDQPPAEGRCVSAPDQLVNMGDVGIAAPVCTYP